VTPDCLLGRHRRGDSLGTACNSCDYNVIGSPRYREGEWPPDSCRGGDPGPSKKKPIGDQATNSILKWVLNLKIILQH